MPRRRHQPELEVLRDELGRLNAEASASDQAFRESLLREQTASRNELCKAVQRDRFGLALLVIGTAFGCLLAFLPQVESKAILWGMALLTILFGAREKDRAHKRIAEILPRVEASEILKHAPR